MKKQMFPVEKSVGNEDIPICGMLKSHCKILPELIFKLNFTLFSP